MAMRGQAPKRGAQGANRVRISPEPNEWGVGWLSGPLHGITCHYGGASKPCFTELYKGSVECPYCGGQKKFRWNGYVPIRDQTGRPCVLIVGSHALPMVERIKAGSYIRWGRGKRATDPIWIKDEPAGKPWEHYWPETPPADDLVPWLVLIWQLFDHEDAIRKFFAGDSPLSTVPQRKATTPTVTAQVSDVGVTNGTEGKYPATVGTVIEDMRRRGFTELANDMEAHKRATRRK